MGLKHEFLIVDKPKMSKSFDGIFKNTVYNDKCLRGIDNYDEQF